jgi:hypothetical protein
MDGLLIVVAVASGIAVLVLGLAHHAAWPVSTLIFARGSQSDRGVGPKREELEPSKT